MRAGVDTKAAPLKDDKLDREENKMVEVVGSAQMLHKGFEHHEGVRLALLLGLLPSTSLIHDVGHESVKLRFLLVPGRLIEGNIPASQLLPGLIARVHVPHQGLLSEILVTTTGGTKVDASKVGAHYH